MFSLRRWLNRLSDRRPVVRIRRSSYRKPWWRRSGQAWLMLLLLGALIGAIALLLGPAQAFEAAIAAGADEIPLSP